ncbi:Intraflagellar transport protein 52 -like protein [Toxocara canis]|uniref:Intraflagellar transport protein 52-like protein n=1 Tax=Toxocara canis TaxID=6265 RepID=A0A0B2V6C9_TOXCA|nr:Intraflagellar transport protein 52 -like protein [Toxocara canis]
MGPIYADIGLRYNEVMNGVASANNEASSSGRGTGSRIVFDQSKKEHSNIHSGFRQLHRRLKNAWRVEANTEEINSETFNECRVFIIPHPRAKFTQEEFEHIHRYLEGGGNVIVLMAEGGETAADTNINFLLEQFGIACNNDAVIRTIFYKYFEPKEALISNGVLNRAIASAAGKSTRNNDDENNAQALSFVYPFGSTLTVNRLSTAILSTGSACYPINRPICAFHKMKEPGGKIVAVGSVQMFCDQYVEKEENMKIWDVILKYLTEGLMLNQLDSSEPDLADEHPIPDHIYLSEQIKVCLQEGDFEAVQSGDFMKLFDTSLHTMDLSMWAKSIAAYEQVGLKHEPLTLIVPHFEVPLPPLQPAVFPPNFRELPPPQLELFDLDEMFSSTDVRLAQLANKCDEVDLEYFVKEAGEIFGITRSLPANDRGPKRILEYVLHQVAEFKKLNQEEDDTEQNIVDTAVELFEPGFTQDEEPYFSDMDEYDDPE